MDKSSTDRKDREHDRPASYFSCAFCKTNSPKPFKICETCGQSQPDAEEE
jgi:hypothetical protein